MTTHDPVTQDLERTIDELRQLLHSTKELWYKADQDRKDWQDIAQRAIAQIAEWRLICDEYQRRYDQLLGKN